MVGRSLDVLSAIKVRKMKLVIPNGRFKLLNTRSCYTPEELVKVIFSYYYFKFKNTLTIWKSKILSFDSMQLLDFHY